MWSDPRTSLAFRPCGSACNACAIWLGRGTASAREPTSAAADLCGTTRRYARVRAVEWAGKQDVTCSDAITAVRRWLWLEWVFAIPGYKPVFEKLSRPFRSLLLH